MSELSNIQASSMAFYHLHSSIFLFLFIMAILSFLPTHTYSISFSFPDFSHNPQLVRLEGDAFLAGGAIEVTRNSADRAIDGSVGRATYSEPIKLWDTTTRKLADFDTQFSFSIKVVDNTSARGYGDGLTFFLAPYGAELPPESAGGSLGLISQNVSAQQLPTSHIVAVEFDTYKNEWDPDSDHIGIDINSVTSATTKPIESFRKTSGSIGHAWVSYNSTAQNLSVYLTYAEDPVFSRHPIVFQIVDLRNILPENISVGFSAATGIAIELHRVLSWQFNSTLGAEEGKVNTNAEGRPNGTNPSNITGVHKVTDGQMTQRRASKSVLVGVVVSIGVLGCALGLSLFIWLKKKKNSRNLEDQTIIPSTDDEFEKETGPKRFTYSELAHATNNFDEAGKLGEGGFGGVYKGFLSDTSLDIAVKRISSESKQGKKEYQSEVKIISQLRHRNLVQLIGWCHEINELLLVYEFLPNRSLDKHLFKGNTVLTWEVRYKIALGLASALVYLHEAWEQCVVHRDIKSSNIMLDSNFNAKLGDFGLARLVDHEAGSQTTLLAGTMGYLAPECLVTYKASKESDIYSFGIVALELACGRRPIDASKGVLLEWVWKLYGCGMVVEAADERLYKNFDEQQMERLMVLGLCCAHPDAKSRPSIRQAISILNFESPLPVLPSKLPTPEYPPQLHIYRLDSQTDGSQGACSSCSNPDLSQSTISSSGSASKSLLNSDQT